MQKLCNAINLSKNSATINSFLQVHVHCLKVSINLWKFEENPTGFLEITGHWSFGYKYFLGCTNIWKKAIIMLYAFHVCVGITSLDFTYKQHILIITDRLYNESNSTRLNKCQLVSQAPLHLRITGCIRIFYCKKSRISNELQLSLFLVLCAWIPFGILLLSKLTSKTFLTV